jgi:hypothetical protein
MSVSADTRASAKPPGPAQPPVSVETAIKELLPRVLQDQELTPKLGEHHLTQDEIREALTEGGNELAAATSQAQTDWAFATSARQEAQDRRNEYLGRPFWRRAGDGLIRRIAPYMRRQPSSSESQALDSSSSDLKAPFGRELRARSGRELRADLDAAIVKENEAQQEWWDAAYTNWARRRVNELINDYEDTSHRSKLPAVPGSGLAEVFHPEYEVPTVVGAKLSGLLSQMPGGSIGLSGFRGSGKTTLIRSLCRTHPDPAGGAPTMGFVVSAPVRYEPREFVLYLFARLCQEILGIPPGREPRDDGQQPAPGFAESVGPLFLLAAGLVALGGAGLEFAAAVTGTGFGHLLGTPALRIVTGAGLVLAAAGLLFPVYRYAMRARRRRRRYRREYLGPSALQRELRITFELQQRARDWLRDIRYQLTYTSGWSGSLTVSVAQASMNQSTQVEERQRTLPNVIAGYRNLARTVSGQGIRLLIGIDELDKINSEEDAERFLNEVKSIFGIDGCFYLVSVSENAMSNFERRGLPFRDVFDSTFDEIVRIERLYYAQSRLVIKRRTVMPEPFTALCHCLSGGLPRDLIRAARTLYRLNGELALDGSLDKVTQAVITEDLRAKTAASWVELSRVAAEPQASLFKSWFRRVTGPPEHAALGDGADPGFWLVDGDGLYQSCKDFWQEAATWPRPSADDRQADAEPVQRERLTALGLEINAYRYLAATIVQFFGTKPSDSDLRAGADPKAGNASFEMLAEARLFFVNGPLLAWRMISDFRNAHTMESLDPPDPCWLDAPPEEAPGQRGKTAFQGARGRN